MHYNRLQPFQVSRGQASLNISWSLYAHRPLLLHSRRFVCVCVVCDYTCVPHSPLHFDHSLLEFPGLTEFVHVSPTHSRLQLITLLCNPTDECSCDSHIASTKTQAWSLQTLTHTSPSHLVIKFKSSTLLCVCLCSNLLTRKCYDGF